MYVNMISMIVIVTILWILELIHLMEEVELEVLIPEAYTFLQHYI